MTNGGSNKNLGLGLKKVKRELTSSVSSSDLYSDSSIVSSLFTVIIFGFQGVW